jgi:hypothetical protein
MGMVERAFTSRAAGFHMLLGINDSSQLGLLSQSPPPPFNNTNTTIARSFRVPAAYKRTIARELLDLHHDDNKTHVSIQTPPSASPAFPTSFREMLSDNNRLKSFLSLF